jgi:hypothetical protein
MVNKAVSPDRSAMVERLLQRAQDETGLGGAGDPPADDAPVEASGKPGAFYYPASNVTWKR